jgi:hypothetical protein
MSKPNENLATFQAALDELARNAGDAALAKACERIEAAIAEEIEVGDECANGDYLDGLRYALQLLRSK